MTVPGPLDAADRALIVTWMTAGEAEAAAKAGRPGFDVVLRMVQRSVLVNDPDTGAKPGIPYVLPWPGGAAVPRAFLAPRTELFGSLFGSRSNSRLSAQGDPVAAGPARTVRRDLALVQPNVAPREAPAEACAGPRFELRHIEAPHVAGRAKNETRRRLCVYLPPSYATAGKRRYPVIYLLPGLGGHESSGFRKNRGLHELLDAASKEAVEGANREAIMVAVNTRTTTGSSYLVDSPLTGQWDRYLNRTVPAEIDAVYRTIPTGTARALAGQSTGGFNAVSFALVHPDRFGAVLASAPDGLDFESWLFDSSGRVHPVWLAWTRLEDALGGRGQMSSYAADWSPDPSVPRGYRWPFDLAGARAIPAVWERWQAWDPARMIQQPSTLAAARAHLAGRLFIASAKDDEFLLHEPARRFSRLLDRLELKHTWRPMEGAHSRGFARRFAEGFRFLLSVLDPMSD